MAARFQQRVPVARQGGKQECAAESCVKGLHPPSIAVLKDN